MRVLRALRASLAGLGAGYVGSLLAAVWLRAATSGTELVWSFVSPLKLAAWMLASAHGIPLGVRSAAGLRAPEAPGSIGRLSELLGGGEEVAFSFSVVLIPISILAIVGITVAMLVRLAKPSSVREVLRWSAVAGVVHGVALALIAWLASIDLSLEASLAPDLGLGAATGRVGLAIGHPPLIAFAIGTVLGAAFAAAGGISALEIRSSLAPQTRVVLLGWMRGLGSAAAIVIVVLGLGALVALVTGQAPSLGLFALGGYMLWANAVAAGIVLVHGAPMAVALDAGPFTGWERMDLLHFGAVGGSSPKVLLVGIAVPVVAGVVAGRFCRRRSELSSARIAVRFGVLWALTLAVLALLLRVRVLSSLSVGALDLGGGSAAFDPLVTLGLGMVWGTATAFIGSRLVPTQMSVDRVRSALASVATGEPMTWNCPHCRMPNANEDRFCVSCGRPKQS